MMNLSEYAVSIAIKTLKDSPVAVQLKDDIDAVYKYQEAIYVMTSNPDETDINTLRVGTVLAYSVILKIIEGKDPKTFDKEDWKDILDRVADRGVLMDPQEYTIAVFEWFAKYIDFSIEINKESMKSDSAKDIKKLSEEIRILTDDLRNGKLKEADYVDRCMWTSFEAMIKLLAAYKTVGLCPEYAKFIQAVADFSVQYGRMALYTKELELLNSYLEGQEILDAELEAQYRAYLNNLRKKTEVFEDLMNHAFSRDFEQRLKSSVDLARNAGVSDELILDSSEKIDSFFMD